MPPARGRTRKTTLVLLLLLAGVLWLGWFGSPVGRMRLEAVVHLLLPGTRVEDRIGLLSRWDRALAESHMEGMWDELGVDVHLLFLRGLGGRSIEQFAAEEAARRGLGQSGGRERGMLILYDAESDRMRIEVGYGLEPYFPDAYVGHLLEDNLHDYVVMDNMRGGVITTTRLIIHRVREASLGGDFDPRPIELAQATSYPTGGGGASAAASRSDQIRALAQQRRDRERRFVPQPTVEETFRRYHEWLAAPDYDPDASLATPESQLWYAGHPITRAGRTFQLVLEHGKQYRIVERGDLAILYFTDTPLALPNFFRRSRAGWQLDVIAGHRNYLPLIGLPWSWGLRESHDEYYDAFSDLYVRLEDGPTRLRDGDNRPFRTRIE